MDLKATLKAIKLNEPTISTILGAVVILTVGIFLINYLRSKPPSGLLTNPTATSTEESVKPGKHTVAAGEHLWGIAEKYYQSGYNWVDIAEANNLANADLISEGSQLSIPDVAAKTNTVDTIEQAQAPPVSRNQQAISTDQYVVVTGDHLWGIAVRTYGDGYQWTKIWEANKTSIKNPNLIYPEQNLTLPR